MSAEPSFLGALVTITLIGFFLLAAFFIGFCIYTVVAP